MKRHAASPLETRFLWLWRNLPDLRAMRLPAPLAQYRFHPPRRWRFDFAWPAQMIAVEVQGGQWKRGKHTRGGAGFQQDLEKQRTATIDGWLLLCYTTDDLDGADGGLKAMLEVARQVEARS